MIVLGVDPELSNPGVALIERDRHGWRFIESPVLHSLEELLRFLVSIGNDDVHCVCVEDLTWIDAVDHSDRVHSNAQIIRCVGAAQLFALQRRIPCVEVRPQTWKKRIAGSSKAKKEQVRTVLSKIVRGMPERIGLNRSDAIGIGVAGAMESGKKVNCG